MSPQPPKPQPIHVKQALAHGDYLIVVDGAGQLWYRPISAVVNWPAAESAPWVQVTLPEVDDAHGA